VKLLAEKVEDIDQVETEPFNAKGSVSTCSRATILPARWC